MSPGRPTDERPQAAAAVCRSCTPGPEARALLRDDLAAADYLGLLAAEGLNRDAVRFIAHWLTKREAVWWGCLCVWHGLRTAEPPGEVMAALRQREVKA